jgi:Mg2+ and Co2+ transporter CorA
MSSSTMDGGAAKKPTVTPPSPKILMEDDDYGDYEPAVPQMADVTAAPTMVRVSEWKRNVSTPALNLASGIEKESNENNNNNVIDDDDLPVLFLKRERRMTKTELSRTIGVQLRDLRSMTLGTGAKRKTATIAVRPGCIILHLEALQAVVQSDRVFFFNLDNPLMQRVRAEFAWRVQRTYSANPFELRVIESLLIEMIEELEREYEAFAPGLHALLKDLVANQEPRNLQRLHDTSNELADLEDRVEQMMRGLADLLNDDEDMAGMYLSESAAGKPRDVNDHAEVEMMLENFSHVFSELHARMEELKRQIKTTEYYIGIHFDGQRNRLIRINLIVSFWTLSVGTGAFGASVFGMNLLNYFEEHPHGFAVCCAGLALASMSTFALAYMYYLRSKGSPLQDYFDDDDASNSDLQRLLTSRRARHRHHRRLHRPASFIDETRRRIDDLNK